MDKIKELDGIELLPHLPDCVGVSMFVPFLNICWQTAADLLVDKFVEITNWVADLVLWYFLLELVGCSYSNSVKELWDLETKLDAVLVVDVNVVE